MHHDYLFDRITIIGLGLIGSSIARAVHEKELAGAIVGCDCNDLSLVYARKQGFITAAMHDQAAAVGNSNLVILATPPSALTDIVKSISKNLLPGAIVMDISSVKQAAIEAIGAHLPKSVIFIPAHPIAGSEKTGAVAGRADLFKRKRVIITPPETMIDHPSLQKITSFWKELGARVDAMPAPTHDVVYAYVSHLPQLLAFAAMAPLDGYSARGEDNKLLQNFLRLSHSDPTLWTEIFILNKDNILKGLDIYLNVVSHIGEKPFADSKNAADTTDNVVARTSLFPRIAAACLITTVMEAEKQVGFPFARYAGSGFADFTAPAAQPPEQDMSRLSNHHQAVAAPIGEYIKKLKTLRTALASGNAEELLEALKKR